MLTFPTGVGQSLSHRKAQSLSATRDYKDPAGEVIFRELLLAGAISTRNACVGDFVVKCLLVKRIVHSHSRLR